MVQPIRSLEELIRHGGSVRAECKRCKRVALFAPRDLWAHWRRKRWNTDWPRFADHLICKPPEGCGERSPRVTWIITERPPPDDEPPKPRFTRSASVPWKPAGIDQDAWDNAYTDTERKRLVRIARG